MKKLKGVLIKTNGTYEVIEYNNTLDELHNIVEGYIEYVTIENDMFMIVNEEGWLLGLDLNRLATMFYRPGIVGNALIVSVNDEGDNESLSDKQIELLLEKLK